MNVLKFSNNCFIYETVADPSHICHIAPLLLFADFKNVAILLVFSGKSTEKVISAF